MRCQDFKYRVARCPEQVHANEQEQKYWSHLAARNMKQMRWGMPLKTSGCDSVAQGQYPPGFAFTCLPERPPPETTSTPGESPANQPPVTENRQLTLFSARV